MARASPEPTSSLNNSEDGANEVGVEHRPRVRKRIIWSDNLDHTLIRLSEEAKAIAGRNYLSKLGEMWA